MKRLFLLLASLMLLQGVLTAKESLKEVIEIDISTSEIEGAGIPRSILPEIFRGYYKPGERQMTICFGMVAGDVVVTVTDGAGQIIAQGYADTSLYSSVTFPCYCEKGTYTIRIVSERHEGVGELVI